MRLIVSHSQLRYLNLGLIVAALLCLWLPAPYAVRLTGAALLAFFLPGWALIDVIRLEIRDILERLLLAVGLSYAATVLVSLIVLYVAGRVAATPIIAVLGLASLAPIVVSLGRAAPEGRWGIRLSGRDLVYIGLCAAVAAFLAFTNLGYADYWGDEMNGLLRAVSIIAGRLASIFEHTKGPVEILVPATFGLLVGRFDPFTLRFPFALAHVAGIGAFYLLARRMFSQNVALVAAALLAINGLYLAFGRMVQYQAVFFLTTALSILMAYRFYLRGEAGYLAVTALLTGVGLLAHYDVLLTLPVIAYLVWRRYAQHRVEWRAGWLNLVFAAALLFTVSALFYLPYALNPHLTDTASYLGGVIGAPDWPANNFDALYTFTALYNTLYFVFLMAGLTAGRLVLDLIGMLRVNGGRLRTRLALAGLAAACVVAAALSGANYIPLIIACAVFLSLVAFSRLSVERKAVIVWIGVAFIAYMFLVGRPRTHLQVIFPACSILAALTVRDVATVVRTRLPRPAVRWSTIGAATAGMAFLLFLARYEFMLFADSEKEYVLTYPQFKQSIYWEDARFPFGSRRPYGTPHRLGWQMINQSVPDRHPARRLGQQRPGQQSVLVHAGVAAFCLLSAVLFRHPVPAKGRGR